MNRFRPSQGDVGVVTVDSHFSYLEWKVQSFSELPTTIPGKICSPYIVLKVQNSEPSETSENVANNSNPPPSSIRVILKSIFGGNRPETVMIGIENAHNMRISSCLAEWSSYYQGFACPHLLPIHVVARMETSTLVRLYCEKATMRVYYGLSLPREEGEGKIFLPAVVLILKFM